MNKSSLKVLCAFTSLLTASVVLIAYFGVFRSYAYPPSVTVLHSDTPRDTLLTLIFTGDLMQHQPQVLSAMQRDGTIDYTACFSRLKSYFDGADYVITNLETTLGDPPYTGYPQFRAPMALAKAMRHAGIDIAVVANNHICDRGQSGIHNTLTALHEAGIPSTGAFSSTLPDSTHHPLWLTKKGFRIALFNYTYGTNGLPVPRGCSVNHIDTLTMQRDIRAARQSGAQHVIVFVHWGTEYQTVANRSQRSIAAACHRVGGDLVIGSHPHVVQSIETLRDAADRITGVTVFSMGNFFTNQSFPGTDGGISVRLRLYNTSEHSSIGQPEYLIDWTAISPDRNSRSGHRYEVIPSYGSQALPCGVRTGFSHFVSRTRSYMQQHSPDAHEITEAYDNPSEMTRK